MLPFLRESFGNPGTPHQYVGGIVQTAVRKAREQTAELINCRPNELIWTSGATESNNLAILGFAENVPSDKRHLITQVTEHSAVLEPCRYLEARGWDVTYLSVNERGEVSVEELKDALTESTSLVSIMWGNNEIGTIQPIKEIAETCSEQGVAFHCDAAQAVGKVTVDVDAIPIRMLTFSAHKNYGPKGAGALYVKDLNKINPLTPLAYGGGQEHGLRPGTLNVPSIIGMGACCQLANSVMATWTAHTSELRDHLEKLILAFPRPCEINGALGNRLPHISNIAFVGVDSEDILAAAPGIVASTGSACHRADFDPSHVLVALKKAPNTENCSLRFGLGKDVTLTDVFNAAKLLAEALSALDEG